MELTSLDDFPPWSIYPLVILAIAGCVVSLVILVGSLRPEAQVFGKPAWSPDRKEIAFTVAPSTVWSRVVEVGGFPYDGSKVWLLEIASLMH